jgi:Tol biopolymer transport system component
MRARTLASLLLLSAVLVGAQCAGGVYDAKGRFLTFIADPGAPNGGSALLFQTDLKTGNIRQLSGGIGPGANVNFAFDADPKLKHVVYAADVDTPGLNELFSANLKTTNVVKLNGPLAGTGIFGEGITETVDLDPKGRYVGYVTDQDTSGVFELYRSDLENGGNLKLNATLVSGGDVNSFAEDPKGRYAVYSADQDVDEKVELYRSDLVTGDNLKLSGPMTGDVDQILGFDGSGKFVVYTANQDFVDSHEVYRTDVVTGSGIKISDGFVAGGSVQGQATLDSKRRYAVYMADAETIGVVELYRSDIKSGLRLKLSGELVPGITVTSFLVDPLGKSAVFITAPTIVDGNQPGVLWRADLKTGKLLQVSGTTVTNGLGVVAINFIDPKGRYAIYEAEQDTVGRTELYSSDLKTGTSVKLNGPMQAGGEIRNVYDVDPSGHFAVFEADLDGNSTTGMYYSDLKTGATTSASNILPDTHGFSFVTSLGPKGKSVAFVTDQITDGQFELFHMDFGSVGVARLSKPMVAGGNVQDLFAVDPLGRYAIYAADADTDGIVELYQVDLKTHLSTKVSGIIGPGGSVVLNQF